MNRKIDFVIAKVNYHFTPGKALKQLQESQGVSQMKSFKYWLIKLSQALDISQFEIYQAS